MTDEQLHYHDVRAADGESRRIAYRLTHARTAGLPGVFWLSGFHSDMSATKVTALARHTAETGQAFLRFDYSGDGLSPGRPEDGTVSRWLAEAAAIFLAYAAGSQIIVGSSMGGWLALLLIRRLRAMGQDRRAAGLVMIAPAWDMTRQLMMTRFPPEVMQIIETQGIYIAPSPYSESGVPITRALLDDGHTHSLAGTGFDPGCPVRILHGMRDPDVPWQHSVRLMDELSQPDMRLTLVKDAEHRLSRDQDLAALFALVAELTASPAPGSHEALRDSSDTAASHPEPI